MDSLRRKLAEMMANPGKAKPYYCEVEYLESTGTQYINTGIYLTNNHSVEIHYQLTAAAQSRKGIYGGLGLNGSIMTSRHGALLSPSNSYLEGGYGAGNVYYQLGMPDTNRHILKQEKNKLYFDGVLKNTFDLATFTQDVTAPLGNFTYTNYNPASAKYYYSKWWDGDKLVRDYIPVLGWDGKGYMYDKVSGELFGNAGSGDFLYGREIHYVEYLESTGTQYIDTGYIPTNNSVYKFKGECTQDATGTRIVFGSLNTNNTASSNAYLYNSATNSRWGTSTVQNAYATVQTPHTCQVDKNGYTVDGHTENFASGSFTGTSTNAIIIFGFRNAAGTVTTGAKIKLWYLTIEENGIIVRDYKPAIDENGIGYMFDKVQHVCYLNAGTGVFKYSARKLNYLESSGTQYIDTNYAFTDDFSWEIDFEGITGGTTLFGGRTSTTRTALLYQRNYGGVDKTTCPIAGFNGQETPFQLDDLRVGRHKVKMSVASNKGSVWVDDVQVYNNQSFTGTYITGTTQALFADKFGTNDYREQTPSKVYGLKMWQGTTLVRDFIPVYKDGNLGMWDKVNNVFYTNIGTGTFVLSKVYESRYFN